jgi:pimeloyl-ACP methyl ester carboxylesterase
VTSLAGAFVAGALLAGGLLAAEVPVIAPPPKPEIGPPRHEMGLEPNATLRLVVAPGETLTVAAAAEGRPVVIVPGLFGLSWGWRHLVPLLVAQGFRPIIIEPLGVGHSGRPRGADYSLTAQADRVDRVMGQLGVERAPVIAHGVGASIAFRLALRHPERVAGIVSIEGGPSESAASPTLGSIMKFAPILKMVAGEGMVRGKVRSLLEKSAGDKAWITDDLVNRYSQPLVDDFGAAAAAFRAMAASTEAESLAPNLPRINVPVELLLGGAPREYSVPAEELTAMRTHLPQFQSVAIPGAGHYIQEEQAPAVMVALLRVLRRAG